MRHKAIETTLKYYVAQDADDVADELWASYRAGQKAQSREMHSRPKADE